MYQIDPIHDFVPLLAPIAPDAPCGDDTREDASPQSPYFTLKDLRSQARALERQVFADDEVVQVTQWRQLANDIPLLLVERTKDLEYVAWLIEALCREYGFAGLAEGFRLARELVETHWDDLYPSPDEEGLATRMAPLNGLNGVDAEGTLIQPILSIPLFESDSGNRFAAWHAEQAAEVGRLEEGKARNRIKTGAASPDQILGAVAHTPVARLAATREAIQSAQLEYMALSDIMDRVMGGDPQPTTNIRSALDRCLSVLAHHAGERIDNWISEQGAAGKTATATAESAAEGAASDAELSGSDDVDPIRVAIESRSQALTELRKLSDFFLKTEPHSPVAYAIGQAVRWSEMSLPELMEELITDSGARDGFYRLTGVPAPEPRD
ncbi:type VI secretion system protein TssA [uncultured Marinobacter sp.]|uniref:type VI secretion system protein TssA n=1 Tax=uncultured Marinobacter sp. TaxID=187379 RepID=UPI0030DACA53